MKTNPKYSLIALCAISLLAVPAAFANDDEDFQKMDANGDGFITREEAAASGKQMFARADTDHDGRLSLAELQASPEAKEHGDMAVEEQFKQCDKNGDGKITAEEQAASGDAMFDQMDTDHDGKISKEECKAGHQAMKKDAKKEY